MFRNKNRIVFSPSDFTRYVESPFASWMDRSVLEQPDSAATKDPEDPLMQVLQRKGFELEAAIEAQFCQEGYSLQRIEAESREQGYELTRQALRSDVDVIAQAHLVCDLGDCLFSGVSDFLIRTPDRQGFEIWDAKLSTKVKPSFLLQLCSYALMLKKEYGIEVEKIGVLLGNGERQTFSLSDYSAYFRQQLNDFLSAQKQFTLNGANLRLKRPIIRLAREAK